MHFITYQLNYYNLRRFLVVNFKKTNQNKSFFEIKILAIFVEFIFEILFKISVFNRRGRSLKGCTCKCIPNKNCLNEFLHSDKNFRFEIPILQFRNKIY